MKIIIRRLILLLIVMVSIVSCTRKPLSEECACLDKVSLPISIDWLHSNINVQNVTLLVYNSIDSTLLMEHVYEHNSNEIQSQISLPNGVYTVVVFNELRDEIDNILCRGYENLSTLEFYSKVDNPIHIRSNKSDYVKQTGDLAIKVIENIEILSDLTITKNNNSKINPLQNIKPVKITSTIDITAHVKGLNNSRMPALADLRNVSSGYMVSRDKNSTTTSNIQFPINNRVYDNTLNIDGVISATVTSFGTIGTRGSTVNHMQNTPIEIDILFMLVDKDKTVENRVVDVTNIITSRVEANSTISYKISADIKDALTNVKPEGSTDSGFNAEVEDWDSVDIPLYQ